MRKRRIHSQILTSISNIKIQDAKDLQSQFRMKEDLLTDQLSTFDCLACQRKAHLPVLTRCAHLFCWKCYHQTTNQNGFCSVCKEATSKQDIYPLFIQNQQEESEDINLPDRPPPKHVPKIANAGAIATRNQLNSNNIALGRSFAGQVFLPALGVAAWSQMGDPLQVQHEKQVNFPLKCILIGLSLIVFVAFGVQLFS